MFSGKIGENKGRPGSNARKIMNFGVDVGFFKIYIIWGVSLVKKGAFSSKNGERVREVPLGGGFYGGF